MEPEPDQQFHAMLWQKLVPLMGVPILGLLLFRAPVTAPWGTGAWIAVGALVGLGATMYLVRSWQKARIVLNNDGLRMFVYGRAVTWPYEDVLNVKQVGRYRVRLCLDTGQDDGSHTHVSLDLSDSDAFVDALLDRYARSTGTELDDGHEALAA